MCLDLHITPSRSTAHQLSQLRACEALVSCWAMCRNVSFITLPGMSWYSDWQTVSLSICICRSRRKEAAQHYPEEHGDGTGRRDEKQDDQAGQPWIHRRKHEQLQLRGKVSSKTCANRTLLTNIICIYYVLLYII